MKDRIQHGIYVNAIELLVSLMLSLILGFSPQLLGELYISIELNVFAIPLMFVFNFPLWTWYVIVMTWISAAIYWKDYVK